MQRLEVSGAVRVKGLRYGAKNSSPYYRKITGYVMRVAWSHRSYGSYGLYDSCGSYGS